MSQLNEDVDTIGEVLSADEAQVAITSIDSTNANYKKVKGPDLTWDDINALGFECGTSTELKFIEPQDGWEYIYYKSDSRFVVKDSDGNIVYDTIIYEIADFLISWDIVLSEQFVVYYLVSNVFNGYLNTEMPITYRDKYYSFEKNIWYGWNRLRILPKSEKYRVTYYRVYGDEMTWRFLNSLNLMYGEYTEVKYETPQSGWEYVYKPQVNTFTVYNTNGEVVSTIQFASNPFISQFGISWAVFTSHQFYVLYEYHIYNDYVLFDSDTMADDSGDEGLTVMPIADVVRANNPIRQRGGVYKIVLFKFVYVDAVQTKIYGDEITWDILEALKLTSGENMQILFPQIQDGWEYYYRAQDDIFTVKDENGNVRYEIRTTMLSKFGIPWEIFSSHQFYILYGRLIADDMYLEATRIRKKLGYLSLQKYLIPLLSVVMATISNRGNAVYEPWMLWKLWQWLGTPDSEVVYTFDIMPNWA